MHDREFWLLRQLFCLNYICRNSRNSQKRQIWPGAADLNKKVNKARYLRSRQTFEKWPDLFRCGQTKMTRRRRTTTFQLLGPRLRLAVKNEPSRHNCRKYCNRQSSEIHKVTRLKIYLRNYEIFTKTLAENIRN